MMTRSCSLELDWKAQVARCQVRGGGQPRVRGGEQTLAQLQPLPVLVNQGCALQLVKYLRCGESCGAGAASQVQHAADRELRDQAAELEANQLIHLEYGGHPRRQIRKALRLRGNSRRRRGPLRGNFWIVPRRP